MQYLKLDFVATDRPGEARAYIRLCENGDAITTRTVGFGELELQIDQLQAELETIRRQGRDKFQAAKDLWAAD